MTRDDLLDIRAALDKASNWAHKRTDLFQIIDAKKKVEALLNEAIEAVVTTNLANCPVIYLDQLEGFQYGDEVKIIIVKEELA